MNICVEEQEHMFMFMGNLADEQDWLALQWFGAIALTES